MGHRHPNSIKQLRPYPKGVSGNPAGTRNPTWSVREHMLQMLATEKSRADLEVMLRDHNLPVGKQIAARRLLNAAASGTRFVVGKDGELKPGALDPECGRDADRVMDRTDGKAVTKIEVTRRNEGPPVADLIREAMAIAKQLGPVKVNKMIDGLKAKLAASERHAPVDTTATAIDDDPDAVALSKALDSV